MWFEKSLHIHILDNQFKIPFNFYNTRWGLTCIIFTMFSLAIIPYDIAFASDYCSKIKRTSVFHNAMISPGSIRIKDQYEYFDLDNRIAMDYEEWNEVYNNVWIKAWKNAIGGNDTDKIGIIAAIFNNKTPLVTGFDKTDVELALMIYFFDVGSIEIASKCLTASVMAGAYLRLFELLAKENEISPICFKDDRLDFGEIECVVGHLSPSKKIISNDVVRTISEDIENDRLRLRRHKSARY
jgi:hypothetical protein